jgi:hypothetical protein
MALSAPNSTVLPPYIPPYPAIRPEQLRYRCDQTLHLPAQRCRLSHPRHQRSCPNPHAIRNQSNGQKITTYLTFMTENLSPIQTMTPNMLSITATWELRPFRNEPEALPFSVLYRPSSQRQLCQSLHLNSVSDTGVRMMLSALLITIIHFANASTCTHISVSSTRRPRYPSDPKSVPREMRRCITGG